jgi:hypothetical protein
VCARPAAGCAPWGCAQPRLAKQAECGMAAALQGMQFCLCVCVKGGSDRGRERERQRQRQRAAGAVKAAEHKAEDACERSGGHCTERDKTLPCCDLKPFLDLHCISLLRCIHPEDVKKRLKEMRKKDRKGKKNNGKQTAACMQPGEAGETSAFGKTKLLLKATA